MPDMMTDDLVPNENGLDFSMMEDAVGYSLRRAQLAVFQHFNEAFSSKGLRPTDFAVLLLLKRNQGSKQSEVAEALGIQRANFVAIVDGLENKGFVERRKSETDRRVHDRLDHEGSLQGRRNLLITMPWPAGRRPARLPR